MNLAIERQAIVFQRYGYCAPYTYTRFGPTREITTTFCLPDVEVVFLFANPIFGCPPALGIFYNGDDGTPLTSNGTGDFNDSEGIGGWGNANFGDITPSVYDINWFCQNAVSIYPSLGPPLFLGTFPRLHNFHIVYGSRNYANVLATPNIWGSLGYARGPYSRRTFWMEMDAEGFLNGNTQISENVYDGQNGTENEISFR